MSVGVCYIAHFSLTFFAVGEEELLGDFVGGDVMGGGVEGGGVGDLLSSFLSALPSLSSFPDLA